MLKMKGERTPREEAMTKRKGAVLDLSCYPGWQLIQSFLFRKIYNLYRLNYTYNTASSIIYYYTVIYYCNRIMQREPKVFTFKVSVCLIFYKSEMSSNTAIFMR